MGIPFFESAEGSFVHVRLLMLIELGQEIDPNPEELDLEVVELAVG